MKNIIHNQRRPIFNFNWLNFSSLFACVELNIVYVELFWNCKALQFYNSSIIQYASPMTTPLIHEKWRKREIFSHCIIQQLPEFTFIINTFPITCHFMYNIFSHNAQHTHFCVLHYNFDLQKEKFFIFFSFLFSYSHCDAIFTLLFPAYLN